MEQLINLEAERKEYIERLKIAESHQEENLILGMIDYISDKIKEIINNG